MKKITLVLGGIRSGKSYFAEKRAEFYSEEPVYIATSISFDREMEERITMHRKRRGDRYELIEEPYDLTVPLAGLRGRTVLVDCLTLNLSNRLLAREKEGELKLAVMMREDGEYLEALHEIILRNDLNVIFVSNEVGFAPIEPSILARYFQDLQGRWNRILAGFADEVYMVQAGLSSQIKKVPLFPFKISAPSYLLPTGYIENVTYLTDKVDDVQLLVFDYLADDPLFKSDTVKTLQYLAKEPGLTYSVHMPVSPRLFDGFEKRLTAAFSIIEALEPLDISSYTFHYDLPEGELWQDLNDMEKRKTSAIYIEFFKKIKERFPGIDISLENTATPLSALDGVVSGCAVSYAIDIGHLVVQGWELDEIGPRLERASVVHLHGWEEKDGKLQDHRAIVYSREIFTLLESFKGILTIENYHKLLFSKSLEVLKSYY
ncbi:MAG: hypothetical protein GY757_14725 [bacterium]|nr:hypothetical protein [bacterium]